MDDVEILDFENNEINKDDLTIPLIKEDDIEEVITEKDYMLSHYGDIISKKEYITNPAIERDQEIKKLILALLIPEKSAILVGKPGVGKTAIVEGLAYRIQKGDIPLALKNFSIIKINITSLIGTTSNEGNTEAKIQTLIDELKPKKNVILFIDEIHTLIGTKNNTSLDFANMLKNGLDRGTLKLIGATTTEEFDFYIVKDRAFLRRFEKIEIEEPTAETTVKILMGTIPKIERQTKVKWPYSNFVTKRIVTFMVNMTSEYKRIFEATSRYPDIAFNLLNKAFSISLYHNSDKVTFKYIYEAIRTFEAIYPDVLIKEIALFKNEFDDLLTEENVNLKN